ncbi:MAG: FAD-dependent oxidoreductase [Clostridia bacterium]|nr:FAD-dependent oxidoreductase [Clostridia bacterium]
MSVITLSDIKLSLSQDEKELFLIAQKKLKRKPQYFEIKKKSLDARDKNNIRYVYTIAFSAEKQDEPKRAFERLPIEKIPKEPVLVVGSGPAGLFAALRLLDHGITPMLIERGAPVEERERDTQLFFTEKTLNVQSNVQFGEGGAGTFSDGKLNTQTHSPLNREVLETFVRFGAPKEILWLQKPHIGSDNLIHVVRNMRQYIIEQGGQVRFHTRLTDISIENGRLQTVTLQNPNGEEKLSVSAVVLAIGHSARDTFERLLARGIYMRQKDFAVGVRIEHLQSEIGKAQYGNAYTKLPAADYKLVSHVGDRAAFTFCMCPGGIVVPATSEEGCVVTNGMSNYARDERNANSALIAQVTRADFEDDTPLAGMRLQRKLEQAAYLAGGGTYAAPVQKVGDFLRDRTSDSFGSVVPSYAAGTTFADLRAILPSAIVSTLKGALTDMDRRLKGFACPDALMTAVETRTSSPLRMERDERMQALGVENLFPCGEGAGYAGGITSSAADGLKIATAVFAKLNR